MKIPRLPEFDVYLHVTEQRFVKSILSQGLCPWKSRRESHRVWLCTEDAIAWAVNHVNITHHEADNLTVLAVLIFKPYVKSAGLPGVFFTETWIPPHAVRVLSQATDAARKMVNPPC